jgi:hypothetical protein
VPAEALFSSLDGGAALRRRVLEELVIAGDLARQSPVDLHVMAFALTDGAVADLILELAAARPALSVRVLADWGQGSNGSGRVTPRLARAGLPNLAVRYKHDQPYVYDAGADRIRWSYAASRGLLHHKTLGVAVAGSPRTLVCGSFNWTGRGSRGYENLMVITAGDGPSDRAMAAMEGEFAALWTDGAASLSPSEAAAHHAAVLAEYRADPSRPAAAIVGIGAGDGAALPGALPDPHPKTDPDDGSVTIAFSSRSPSDVLAGNGYATDNRSRRLDLHKPGGAIKSVPLTLTTLALDTITRATPGDRLLVAMYGLSARVPEYGAMLDAARRGVRVLILLDRAVSEQQVARLGGVAARERLPIRVRSGVRTMHEKYVVHPESGTVLTGTANMSTDASGRHTEHRVRWRGESWLTARFLADFETIWGRLASPFAPAGHPGNGHTAT